MTRGRCTIVIPVHNRAALTRRCLEALLSDPPESPHEIVVVDDASTDSTTSLLEGYGDQITVVRRSANAGFAAACNDGAKGGAGKHLVFLNNDTVPLTGWLDALIAHAERSPRAAVVGSKLLFPNGTVQHAGVVICQDKHPRHLYAGFPGDHPAVNKSRRFQAVTAGCALFLRSVFEEAQGFDPEFRNSYEDVDLCLRIGELGYEVHYCHESVLHHLESASRPRRSKEIEESAQLYRRRWGDRVRADDVDYYVEDGLLRFHYRDAYPVPLQVSPQLAVASGDAGAGEAERLLAAQSRELVELLKETVRLSAHIAELELAGKHPTAPPEDPAPPSRAGAADAPSSDALLRRARQIEIEIYELQRELAAAARENGSEAPNPAPASFAASEYLGYQKLLAKLREVVHERLPEWATVLVVSRGDDELLELASPRAAWHFPQDEEGGYPGHHPPDSSAAIVQLEELRTRGADFLLIPRTALWWLDHYADFARHLERYPTVISDPACCAIFDLTAGGEPR